ncbi:hypothetical protein SCP_0803760 [Sparassis crispa]|uniref:Uncharacterized protein n=1 Tax=Sparassis crispa TaxID=139825 RepID=A0A401GVR8_9APHY|nr:hypothetical protein SCP_0803760 [Sparassis crispa]GBE85854.1 hypothetical protein SCP_0803760 [Sparassis crispa]
MHYTDIFKRFGPAYSWWLFAFEHCNGEQEQVKLNGHAEGEMEVTMMRNWVAKHRLHELMLSLPNDVSPEERKLIQRACSDKGATRGTLRTQIAGFTSGCTILKPKSAKKFTDLRTFPHPTVYSMLLEYTRKTWPELNIEDDFTTDRNAILFLAARSSKALPFICKDGIHYSSSMDHRSQADRFACIDMDGSRVPCRLIYHFEITISDKPPIVCSIVQRMVSDDDIPTFPWSIYSTDLGVYVAYADRLQDMEVIATDQLAAAVAIIPITSKRLGNEVPLWVVHSFDRVS